jgi:hypothetical protein
MIPKIMGHHGAIPLNKIPDTGWERQLESRSELQLTSMITKTLAFTKTLVRYNAPMFS